MSLEPKSGRVEVRCPACERLLFVGVDDTFELHCRGKACSRFVTFRYNWATQAFEVVGIRDKFSTEDDS